MFELIEYNKTYVIRDTDTLETLIEFSMKGIDGAIHPKEILEALVSSANLSLELNRILNQNLYNSDPQLFMQLVVPAIKGSK